MTLPPTSVHVIVWCGDTPVVLRGHSAIDASDTSAQAVPGVHVGQPVPKAASKVSQEACRSSEECVGSHASHRPNYESSGFVMVWKFSLPFCLVLVILASHFRARMDLPKKRPTWNPA